MGWWWSSSSPDTSSSSAPPATPSPSPSAAIPAPSQSSSLPPSPSPTQADQDADFYAAHPHLAPPPSSHPSPNTPDSPSATDPDIDPSYPTTMSCRAAFDSAFYCSSFGGHFNDIYRYGQLRSCTEHWADFRFCMRIKVRGEREKMPLIQERYKEKEDAVRGKPNSEDLWRRLSEGEREKGLGAFRPGWRPEGEQ